MNENDLHIRDVAHLREALGLLGSLLDSTSDEVGIAVVGGSALLIDGRVTRVTRDVDVVAFIVGEALLVDSPRSGAPRRHLSAADQGPESKHMHDVMVLEPTSEELDSARLWCCTQDVSNPFADEVDAAVAWVKREIDG